LKQTDLPGPPFAAPVDLGVAHPTGPSTGPTKRPWFLYGCFLLSLTFALASVDFLVHSEPLMGFAVLIAVIASPICLFGLLDKYLLRRNHATIPHPALAWITGTIFVVALLGQLLVLLIVSVRAANQQADTQQAGSRNPQSTVLTSPQGDVEISLPSGWKRDPDTSGGRDLGAINPSRDASISVSGKETRAVTLEAVAETIRLAFTKQKDMSRVSDLTRIQVDGYPVMQFEGRGTSEGKDSVILYAVARVPNADYLIQVVAPAHEYDLDPETFRSLVRALRFHEAGNGRR
jgi:hypothetical protein